MVKVCSCEFELNIRLMCVVVYFVLLVLWLCFLNRLLFLIVIYLYVIFSRFMKKLFDSVFVLLVNMLCEVLLWFVFSICRLFIRMVIFGVVSVSSWVWLISNCFVDMLNLVFWKLWKLLIIGFIMLKDLMLVCFCVVFVWFVVNGIVILIFVFLVVCFIVVVLFRIIRLVIEMVLLKFVWIFFRMFSILVSCLGWFVF